jgi:hypothetical protein
MIDKLNIIKLKIITFFLGFPYFILALYSEKINLIVVNVPIE